MHTSVQSETHRALPGLKTREGTKDTGGNTPIVTLVSKVVSPEFRRLEHQGCFSGKSLVIKVRLGANIWVFWVCRDIHRCSLELPTAIVPSCDSYVHSVVQRAASPFICKTARRDRDKNVPLCMSCLVPGEGRS